MNKKTALLKMNEELEQSMNNIYAHAPKILVFGAGNPDARILLIGEAPGEQETLQRTPFVGRAGRNLDSFLEMLEIARSQLYITNAVKFRPTKANASGRFSNRPPTAEEIALFSPWLHREIAIVAPEYILPLGNVALRAVLGKGITIGNVHGRIIDHEVEGSLQRIFPLYHPASIIYNRALAHTYDQDLQTFKEILRQERPIR